MRYLARRFRWPDGVAEACVALEERYPAFGMFYAQPPIPRYGRTGYFARRRGAPYDEPSLYGATPDELESAIQAAVRAGGNRGISQKAGA